jgi:hypothetical protein
VQVLALIESDLRAQQDPGPLLHLTANLKAQVRWLEGAHAFALDGQRLQAGYGIEVKNLPRLVTGSG